MMTEEERVLVAELVDSFDGTCVHQWDLTSGTMPGSLIVDNRHGRRFVVSLAARALPSSGDTNGSREI